MIALSLDRPRSVLAVGAHSDDIEIGCGGTLLRMATSFPDCRFTWLVLCGDEERDQEARKSAGVFFGGGRAPGLLLSGLRDGHLPAHLAEVKSAFEQARVACEPDVVFTHQRADLHQDHRACSEAAWQTFRDHLVLEYEIPKYDGDLGAPNVFVGLEADVVGRKVDHLMENFASQRSKRWFSRDVFHGLARLRGLESGVESGLAEGFYARKAVIG